MLNRVFKIIIASAIIAASMYYSFNSVIDALIHNREVVETPNLVGKSLHDCLDELSKKGFGLIKSDEQLDQNIPAGIVLRQNPQAGMLVRKSKTIRVTISQGGEVVYVPNLIGQTVRSADISLRYATLVLGEVERRFSTIAGKDHVILQDIQAGQKVDKDSVVNIIVSEGLPPEGVILVPNFMNKNIQEAKAWALENSIVLDTKTKTNQNIEENIIVDQYHQTDTDITDTKYILLTVSTYETNSK